MMRIAAVGQAALAAVVLAGIAAGPAQAAFTFTVTQQGPDVVATGSGTVNLTGLTFVSNQSVSGGVNPGLAVISSGQTATATNYSGLTGPASFGALATIFASSSSGDVVRILGTANVISVPEGYVSGDPLSTTVTFAGSTFASLSMTPGTYTWTWGTGRNADSLTVQIGAVAPVTVPVPASAALLGLGLFGLTAAARRQKAPARG